MTAASTRHVPATTWWGEAWRLGLAALAGLIMAGEAEEAASAGYEPGSTWTFVDLLIGLAVLPLLLWRRRWPVPITMGLVALGAVTASTVGAGGLALVSLSTRRNWSTILPAAALYVGAAVAFERLHPDDATTPVLVVVVMSAITACLVAIGMFIGARRELVTNLTERAETIEREHVARLAQAQLGERNRIAREMHDMLAHRISLVAMHAGALNYRHDLSAEEMGEIAEVIQTNAHTALGELRDVLGVLRDPAGPHGRGAGPDTAGLTAVEAPQPSLADVGPLVDSARQAGQTVMLRVDLADEPLAPAVSRHAYRIVQEALTNARKHAADQPVTVTVIGGPGDGLVIDIRNPTACGPGAAPAPIPGAGLGLLGLTERADAAGGHLRHGIDRAGVFVVSATLPWPDDGGSVR